MLRLALALRGDSKALRVESVSLEDRTELVVGLAFHQAGGVAPPSRRYLSGLEER